MPVDEEGVNNFFQKMEVGVSCLFASAVLPHLPRLISRGALFFFFLLRAGYILAQICRIPGALSGQALQGVIMMKRE